MDAPITILNAKFDDNDHDPDWVMETESDSDVTSSQESTNRPPELSPYSSPVKHPPLHPPYSPYRHERRALFTSPEKTFKPFANYTFSPTKDLPPLPSPMKQSPLTSPIKLRRQVYDYHPNDSFPALDFQTPEKGNYTSPTKSGFGYGPRPVEKVSYGSFMSPVKAPYENDNIANQRPFAYADLLPQQEEMGEVTIHKRHGNDATSITTADEKTLFFPVPDVRAQDLHDWSTTVKIEGEDDGEPRSPLKPKVKAHTGHLVVVNGTKLALFRFGEHVFAIKETCPHAGGPLHVGDIEVLPDMSICVRCPWHGWKFDLTNGRARRPLGRKLWSSKMIYIVDKLCCRLMLGPHFSSDICDNGPDTSGVVDCDNSLSERTIRTQKMSVLGDNPIYATPIYAESLLHKKQLSINFLPLSLCIFLFVGHTVFL